MAPYMVMNYCHFNQRINIFQRIVIDILLKVIHILLYIIVLLRRSIDNLFLAVLQTGSRNLAKTRLILFQNFLNTFNII